MRFDLGRSEDVLRRTPGTLGILFLNDELLQLPGEHPRLGRVTLRQLIASWVVHDLGHIAQISRVMAKQYRDEVGGWASHLPVVTDHDVPRS